MIIYDTEFRVWLDHAGLSWASFADLAGVDPAEVAAWAAGKRPVPPWAVVMCQLAASLRVEAGVRDVLDYFYCELPLEPFEVLGLRADQCDQLSVSAALEALEDRYGPTEKARRAAAELLLMDSPADPVPPDEWQ